MEHNNTIIPPINDIEKSAYNMNYQLNEIVIKQFEITKNIILRIIKLGDEEFIDISKFHAGKPTKKGIRFPYKCGKLIKNYLD